MITKFVHWLAWSKLRLLGVTGAACAVAAVAVVGVGLVRLGDFREAAASIKATPSAGSTVSPTVTWATPSYVPTETVPPGQAETISPGEITGPATAVVAAWLAGDPTLAGFAHPDLVAEMAAPGAPSPEGVRIIGEAEVVSDYAIDSALVKVETNRGRIVLTMVRTDEIGWIVKEFTA